MTTQHYTKVKLLILLVITWLVTISNKGFAYGESCKTKTLVQLPKYVNCYCKI